ncbi:DUF3313 domain-containing protein [Novosphingobium sp. BL-8A]|uniref:DUF3313 domain-containing protein n=1 Tax=Novosphingobium sp. BL-8A TaxID=3127639 RepID=UPI0037562DF3
MKKIPVLIVLAGSLPVTHALAQTQDHAPQALYSALSLEHDKKESWTYVKPGLHLGNVTSVLIEPTAVYRGPDAQFDGIPEADREKYAQILTEAIRNEMGKSFEVVSAPAADAVRIRLTLVGATKTVEGVGTVSSAMPLGLATNALKSLTGKKATFSGSVLFAIEMYDAKSGELLAAAVRRQAPDALDIASTLSTTETVKAVADAFARKLRERLVEAKELHP